MMKHSNSAQRAWWSLRDFHEAQKKKKQSEKPTAMGFGMIEERK